MVDRYSRALRVVLDHQPLTLSVAVVTRAITVLLYAQIPKGFFPVQDTELIQGITVAPPDVSYGEMARRQQALVDAVLKDPGVESLSSFIGIDGTNTTLNSGRLLITLKPFSNRRLNSTAIIRRLQQGDGRGHRHLAVHAAGAGSHHRCQRRPRAISFHG